MCKKILRIDFISVTRNSLKYGTEALIIPPGHYSSVVDVITKANEVVSANDRFKDEMYLSLDTLNRKVTVHLRNKTEAYFSDIGHRIFSEYGYLHNVDC